MKSLPAIENMLKMGETHKLQERHRKLCREEAHYLKIVQPWKEEVSQIALKVNEKVIEFKATQTTVVSLLEEPVSMNLVDSTRESVEKCKNDLAELHTSFTKFFVWVNIAIGKTKEKRMKDIGGLGMIHK